MTPRESAEAELLAIEASGEIVAPQALYDRIVVELAALRAAAPEVAAIGAYPAWSPSAVRVTLDGEGLAAYAEGTYHGWDCPNELYRMTEIEISLGTFIVRLEGRYDVMQVGDDYLAAEHVSDVGRESYIGDGPDLCLSIAADVHTYIFDDARGDCPAGCTMHLYTGFTVDPEGTITPLGSYELYGPEPAPAWYEDADACTTWL